MRHQLQEIQEGNRLSCKECKIMLFGKVVPKLDD